MGEKTPTSRGEVTQLQLAEDIKGLGVILSKAIRSPEWAITEYPWGYSIERAGRAGQPNDVLDLPWHMIAYVKRARRPDGVTATPPVKGSDLPPPRRVREQAADDHAGSAPAGGGARATSRPAEGNQ